MPHMTMQLTRRQVAALPLAGALAAAPTKTKKALGFQLYTLRNVMAPE